MTEFEITHGLSQVHPGPLEPLEAAKVPAPRIHAEVEPDPRGVSVGVYLESRCVYNGAHPIPAGTGPERDWELSCDNCNGSGHVFVERQVAERKTDLQEFKEECECCEGRGFAFAFADIPGIAQYVKSCRPAEALDAGMSQEVPAEVMAALDRMCTPLDPSWLKGVTDEVDAKNMNIIRDYILRRPASTVATEGEQKEAVMDAIAEALGDAYDCTRVWSAWGVGTMSQDDFCRVTDDAGRLGELADAAIAAMTPAPAAGDAQDAARYRWLRDPQTDVALVLDKRTGYVPEDESIPGIGGYHTYEYRAGEELDAAIDAAIAQRKGDA